MIRRRTARALPAALLALALAAAPAVAVEPETEAVFNAQPLVDSVPRGGPVEVRVYTQSGNVDALTADAVAALRSAGWTVVEDGAATAFNLEVVGDDPLRPLPEPGVLALEGFQGSGSSDDRFYGRLKLFSTTQSSVLTGTQRPERRSTGGGVRVQADLTDLSDGRRLWQGWVVLDPAGRPPEAAANVVVPALVEMIGQQVREESRLVNLNPS